MRVLPQASAIPLLCLAGALDRSPPFLARIPLDGKAVVVLGSAGEKSGKFLNPVASSERIAKWRASGDSGLLVAAGLPNP